MTFYVQTWDEYYTQILTLGVISGPVEGILTLCTVYGITAYMGGGSFWHQPMLETMGVSKPSFLSSHVYNMPFTQWYLVYGAIMLFFATGSSILHVVQVRRQRGQDPIAPLYGLLPLVAIWTVIPAYLYLQPVILENYTIPFGLFVSLINAYSVGRIIIGHLTQTSFPYQNVLLYPLALGVIDSAGAFFGLWAAPVLGYGTGQVAFVFGCLGLAVGIYGSFVVCSLVFSPACNNVADLECSPVRYYHHDMRLRRHLVPHDQASIRRGDRAQEWHGKEDQIKVVGAVNGVWWARWFNLDHHRRDGSIEPRESSIK